jgi:hypothetical protein
MFRRLAPLVITATLVSGCATQGPEALARIPGLAGATEVYTLTNLHPDDPRPVLYSTNYQRAGLIPVCTRVRIISFADDELHFEAIDTGREYAYGWHAGCGESLGTNAARYFGTECPRAHIATLSDLDRDGIELGVAEVGMSREGVIYAMGYPPAGATRDLRSKVWRYWRNRFASFTVEFDADGHVSRVGGRP